MESVAVLTVQGVSLGVVSNDIAYTARKLGYNSTVFVGYTRVSDLIRNFDRFIMFLPFDTHYVIGWTSLYHSLKRMGYPVKFYTTIEGYPDKALIPEWIPRILNPIANSKFTTHCLESVGIRTEKVVYHGINMEFVDHIYEQNKLEKKLNRDYVLFGSIGFGHPRKGWSKFEELVRLCRDKLPEAKFMVIGDSLVLDRLSPYENVIEKYTFGSLNRVEVLEKIASLDFYICPSHAEGFGLPILEAQSFGVPCIHADYEPLSEFSYKGNFKVKVTKTYEARFMEAINYLMHDYDINEMFDYVSQACDLKLSRKDTYLDLSCRVREHARNFDCLKVYRELVE